MWAERLSRSSARCSRLTPPQLHLTPPQLNLSHTTSPGQVDPKAVELLEAALEEDRSVEWFARKGRSKVEEA